MYYERYLADMKRCPQEFLEYAAKERYEEMIAWVFSDPRMASSGLNFLFHAITLYLLAHRPNEVTDDGRLSYSRLVAHDAIGFVCSKIGTMLRELQPNEHDRIMNAVANTIRYNYHVISYREGGMQSYQVSDGLALELAETKFDELHCEDVRLPYPNLYIEVPRCLGFQVYTPSTGFHPLEGVFVAEDHSALRDRRTGKIAGKGSILKADIEITPARILHTMMIGSSKNEDPMDDATCVTALDMVDGRRLEEEIAATAQAAAMEENTTKFPTIMGWVVNCLLYATWPEAMVEQRWSTERAERLWKAAQSAPSKAQAKRLRKKFEQHHAGSTFRLLGGNILVDRTVPHYSGGVGTGKRLEVRIRVAGHWKAQACGPRHAEHRNILIRPYWRGPEDAPVKFSSHELVARHLTKEEPSGHLPTDLPTTESPHPTVETKDG
jgi:hypothetical protein